MILRIISRPQADPWLNGNLFQSLQIDCRFLLFLLGLNDLDPFIPEQDRMLKVLALFYLCFYLVKTCSFAYLFKKVVVTKRDFARLSFVDIFVYGKGNMNKNVPTLYYLFGSAFCIYFTSLY